MREELNARMRFFRENYLMTARDYGEAGAYGEAAALLGECTEEYPMLCYYRAYYAGCMGEDADSLLKKAENCAPRLLLPQQAGGYRCAAICHLPRMYGEGSLLSRQFIL